MVELKVAVGLAVIHEDLRGGRLHLLRESLIHSMETWGEDDLLLFSQQKGVSTIREESRTLLDD